MTKKPTPKSTTVARTKTVGRTKTAAASTDDTAAKPLNNWHRKMYGLEQKSSDPAIYKKVVRADAKNEFWLEPAVYSGPAMKIVKIQVVPNSLCFRAGFVAQDMADVWRACEFFAAGTEDLTFDENGVPTPDEATQRLQSKATIDD